MLPKATKRKKKKKRKERGGSGHTRGQAPLVRMNNPVDLFSVFICGLRAHYCEHLDPPVDDGTDASDAVLHYMLTPHVTKRLLASLKLRLQRITCKTLCLEIVEPLWNWVRPNITSAAVGADIDQARLGILRSLGPLPPDEDDDAADKDGDALSSRLVKECHTLVVETLLRYSLGKQRVADEGEDEEGEDEETKKKKRRVADEGEDEETKKKKRSHVFPYGVAASWDNESFKQVPHAWFAATLATLYTFVVLEKTGMYLTVNTSAIYLNLIVCICQTGMQGPAVSIIQ